MPNFVSSKRRENPFLSTKTKLRKKKIEVAYFEYGNFDTLFSTKTNGNFEFDFDKKN